VLVTATSYGKHDPALKTTLEGQVGEVIYNPAGRPLSAAELLPLIRGIDGLIAGVECIDRPVIAAAGRLRVIARYGVGVDGVDLVAAREKGIIVANTPGANAGAVAELAIGLMLALARQIPAADRATKAGGWPRLDGLALEGRTVGLVGFGAIGQQVARRLVAFGCPILAHDPLIAAVPPDLQEVQLLPIDQLLPRADFLSLHCPVTAETRRMVDAAFLARLKPGAFLINTARGDLVDENALLAALQSGRLRGAALDVFAAQPPGPDNPLLALPQVIATPHTGAHTDAATNAMGWGALRACLAVLRGEEPEHRVV
jgi:D-3-phosphoglycerate dehydrogenase